MSFRKGNINELNRLLNCFEPVDRKQRNEKKEKKMKRKHEDDKYQNENSQTAEV